MQKYFSLLKTILKYIIIYLVPQIICIFIVSPLSTHKYFSLFIIIGEFISFIIYTKMFKNNGENLLTLFNLTKFSIKVFICIICISIGLAFFVNSFAFLFKDIFMDYNKVNDFISSNTQSFIDIFFIVIVAPIFEEILFRGLIFNECRKYLNINTSIVLQALLFSMFHPNLLQFIYAFLCGIILCLVYVSTNSIIANILVHCIFNLLGGVIISKYIIYYNQLYAIIYNIIGLSLLVISLLSLYKNGFTLNKKL